MPIGLEKDIADQEAYQRTIDWFQKSAIRLPTISELTKPETIDDSIKGELANVEPDAPDALNLFRVHWYNDASRTGFADVPEHVVLPSELTGVDAKILVALGDKFPMIRAHKVLAAYGCLVPRLITGRFDPARSRAIWPSTGNYCRGGVAISRILGCRSAAVLPEGMSRERFGWLEKWVTNPADIVRTYGTESNVKEIYDACHELAQDAENVILNQFNEFGNYIVHRGVTGPALEHIFHANNQNKKLNARAFVSASGSSGTLAAGDYLKSKLGSDVCVVEALECPTLLYNGYGEHNIQGIGDKHVPFIHNVLNTDFAIGVSDKASNAINLLFNTETGREFLIRRTNVSQDLLHKLASLGLSSIANIIAAIKYAKYNRLTADDAVITIATDGAEMYGTELEKTAANTFENGFDQTTAAEVYGRYLLGAATDHTLEMNRQDRERMFNLGYYTWVEQQGISVEDFDARRSQAFWDDMTQMIPHWDEMITTMNAQTGCVVTH